MLNVAVTGVGGGCGQAILSALGMSKLNVRLFAVDITHVSAGHYFYGVEPVVLPKPEENIGAWIDFVRLNAIDAVIPGSDHDLLPLAQHQWDLNALVCSTELVKIANDKGRTAMLGDRIRVPASIMGGMDDQTDFDALGGYPLVIKPRYGMTSRGVQVVHDHEELMFYLRRTERPIVQRYIGGDEYTCALFFDRLSHYCFGFQMKRWLYAGTTYRAEVTNDPIVDEFMREVANKLQNLGAYGAVNIQIKVEDGKAYLLEINARASGSTNIRAKFGYNEPEMMLRHFVLHEDVTPPDIHFGVAYRHWASTVIIDGSFE